MANNLVANPMVITGSLATSYKAQLAAANPGAGINNTSFGTLHTLLVDRIEWLSPATIGDTVTIGDPVSGAVLDKFVCETALQSQVHDFTPYPRVWQDFELNSMPSGTLYIFYHLG
jgi:hypothetical protein